MTACWSPVAWYGVSCFFFSSRRRHTRYIGDWSSDVCSSDLPKIERSGRFEQFERTCDVGLVPLRGSDAPDRPLRHQDLRRDFMRAHNAKSVILERARDI